MFCGFGGVFVCRWISTTTKENQQCCIPALALFADGEDGKFTVSSSLSKLSTALVELTSSDVAQPYKTLQSVTDIKVDITTPPHQSKSTILIGRYVCVYVGCACRGYTGYYLQITSLEDQRRNKQSGEGQLGVHMALALAASKESSILGFLAAPDEVPV